jgi:hypothetical protein
MPLKDVRKRRFILASLALVPLIALSGCGRGDVKVRITATVSSDGKLYSGSSVQEYRCAKSTGIMSATSTCDINGEAVVVDVPGHGHLFLVFDKPDRQSQTEMVRSVLRGGTSDPMGARQDELATKWSLAYDQMPMMVRFKDQADPFSVTQVDPVNLSAEMGPGVNLVSVEMQKSSERVTFGDIEKVIPWIVDPDFSFYRSSRENPLSETFTRSTFISRD